MHDQAEDRCHRIGQHDAVTAWYLLAAQDDRRDDARADRAQARVVDAVTDGRAQADEAVVEGVDPRAARGRPARHLRAVG